MNYQGTYDASKLIITIGSVPVSGMGDGDFFTAEYDSDRVTAKEGADGGVGFSRNPSKLGTITLTLSASSAANDAMSGLFNLDALAGKTVVVPVSAVDLSGRTLVTARNCTLQKAPAVTFGKEIGNREWVFKAADLVMFVGGNN